MSSSPAPWTGPRASTLVPALRWAARAPACLQEALAFRLAHAHTRDAMYLRLDTARQLKDDSGLLTS